MLVLAVPVAAAAAGAEFTKGRKQVESFFEYIYFKIFVVTKTLPRWVARQILRRGHLNQQAVREAATVCSRPPLVDL